MRIITLSLALALTVACSGGDDDKSTDPTGSDTESTDTEEPSDSDTEVEEDDADGDGFTESRGDCDDDDPDIHPAATDICDEIDNDCDDLVDEFYDRDEDGYLDAEDCEHGDDCDDFDAEVNPGAEEIPYDGEDQDCDGSDLNDVDEDGYTSEEVGGEDCDDEDPDVNPDAEDIAKDGIDQDCSGADNYDGDADGYDDEDYGGGDCDDEDESVHPGRYDFWNDGVDSDCDNKDSRGMGLEDALVTIEGVAGSQEWMGWSAASCDLDNDGYDELILGAPLADSYGGQVGIWHGSEAPEWTVGEAMSSADTVISGAGGMGATVACGDVDGDGNQDLVVTNLEVNCAGAGLVDDGTSYVFYGDGGGFDASMDYTDADVSFTWDRDPVGCSLTNGTLQVTAHDLDADGADELLWNFRTSTSVNSEIIGIYVLPGDSYTSDDDLANVATFLEVQTSVNGFAIVEDQDGDGVEDLFIGQRSYADTADTGDTGSYVEGRAVLVASPEEDGDLEDQILSWLAGGAGRDVGLGGDMVLLDVDGDGVDELVASIPFHSDASGDETIAGGLMVFSAWDELGETPVDADGEALAVVLGQDEYGYFGNDLWAVPDVDGDGIDDLLVREIGYNASLAEDPTMWLLSGAALPGATTETDYEDLVLLSWEAESTDWGTGAAVSVGDFDGDGTADFAFSAYASGDNQEGKVYVYLSSTWAE